MNKLFIPLLLCAVILAASCSHEKEAQSMAAEALAALPQGTALEEACRTLERFTAETPCPVALNDDNDINYALLFETLDADADSLLEAEYDALVSPTVTLDNAPLIILCNNWTNADSLRNGKPGRTHDIASLSCGCHPCFPGGRRELFAALRSGKQDALAEVIKQRLDGMDDRTRRDSDGHHVAVGDNLTILNTDLDGVIDIARRLLADEPVAVVHCDYIILPKSHLDGSFESGYTRATITLVKPVTGQAVGQSFTIYAANSDRVDGSDLLANLKYNLLRHVAIATPR